MIKNSITTLFPTFLILALFVTQTAQSGVVVFDLESESETGLNDGALTGLTLNSGSPDALELEITRPGSPNQFDIYDVSRIEIDFPDIDIPEAWGNRSISPWSSNDGTAFVGTFNQPVKSVSISMGDVGGDEDDLFIEAYSGPNGTGTLLGVATDQLSGEGWTEATLTVSTLTPQIQSIRFMGGDDDFEPFPGFMLSVPNSVYYDNITVAIPEPSGTLLSVIGVLFGLVVRRQRRETASGI